MYYDKINSKEITLGEIRQANKHISLPRKIKNEHIEELGYVIIVDTPPTLTEFQKIASTSVAMINNEYTRVYNVVDMTPEEIRAKTVPKQITKVQGMRAMKNQGLWQTFKTVIKTDEDAEDEWILATALERDNPFVAALAPALGLTESETDALFVLGSTM